MTTSPITDPIHPARRMPYDALMGGLERAREAGFVHRRADAARELHLYVYTPRCVYEDGWDEFTRLARGLIIDEAARRVVATPFPKFFNLGERLGTAPALPFEAYEKLDGSLMAADGGRPPRAPSIRTRPPGPRRDWTPPTSPA